MYQSDALKADEGKGSCSMHTLDSHQENFSDCDTFSDEEYINGQEFCFGEDTLVISNRAQFSKDLHSLSWSIESSAICVIT
jgi:hypothetical protein